LREASRAATISLQRRGEGRRRESEPVERPLTPDLSSKERSRCAVLIG
jgi:hypothetical protein